ncbi:MAG TPA: OmpA family protein, partial [Saprospiraceae bacterium]|nr:OmpA family protein [Saprospiraceae bacterium]
TGHTDNVGEADENMKLGARRAGAIKDILVKSGVNANQITTDSKGESQPVASNDTEEGRHDNRRVEVRLIK